MEGRRQEVMQDVACIKAQKDGFLIIDLLGTRTFVRGRIAYLDFIDEHTVLLEKTS
jgi:predicted RNA-binding protein